MIAVLLAYLLAADLTRRSGRSRRPSSGPRPATCRRRSSSRARTSSPGSPTRTTASPRISSGATGSSAGSSRRSRAARRATARSSSRAGPPPTPGRAFGMIDAYGPPRRPGDGRPSRSGSPASRCRSGRRSRSAPTSSGVLVGHLPATRTWDRADQDLLELFASEIAVADPQRRSCSPRSSRRTPSCSSWTRRRTTSCAASATTSRRRSRASGPPPTSSARDRPDRRLGIIVEQTDRLSRMVRQLLTVTRLESGALRPRPRGRRPGQPRVRRAWEALAADGVPFTVDDRSAGWLAVADPTSSTRSCGRSSTTP